METTFFTREIDLAQANTNEPVQMVLKPMNWVQFWCDGSMEGISVKLGVGGNPSAIFPISSMTAIPVIDGVNNEQTLYLTSDVRAGRSKLIIFFVRSENPLPLSIGGEPISAAELAVRLGSISRFDRRGEIIFQDDFEQSNLWTPTAVGYSTAVLSTAKARSGVRSLKLTTGAVAGDNIAIARLIHYPRTPTIGLEVSWVRQDAFSEFIWGMTVYDGTNRRYFGLRHRGVGQVLAYATAAATWSTLVNPCLLSVAGGFNTIKLVVNIATGRYQRVIVGPNPYDMSQLSTAAVADNTNAYISLSASLSNGAMNASYSAYIDDVIITKNEPV